MRWLFLFVLAPLVLQADDDATWSTPVKGLRARFFIAPCRDPDLDRSFEVCIQFENVGVVGSLGIIREERTFSFSVMDLDLVVTDANGRKLPRVGPSEVDEIVPGYNLCLPFGGNMAFPIGYGWSAIPEFPASMDGLLTPAMLKGRYFNINASMGWVIPTAGTTTYYLSGTFSGKLTNAARGFGPGNHAVDGHHFEVRHNWDETLDLPAIKLPSPQTVSAQ